MDDGRIWCVTRTKLVCDQDDSRHLAGVGLAYGFCRAWRAFVVGRHWEFWLATNYVDSN
jgi:hypothetical protein